MKEKNIKLEMSKSSKEQANTEEPVLFEENYTDKEKVSHGEEEAKPEDDLQEMENIETARKNLEKKYKKTGEGQQKEKEVKENEGEKDDSFPKTKETENDINYGPETEKEIEMRGNVTDFHPEKVAGLLEELVADFKPVPERLDIDIEIENITVDNIEEFCGENEDVDAYKKMMIHDIPKEHMENIIALAKKGGENLKKKEMEKLLMDLGYSVSVLISKTFGCDYDAATNIGGYSIPGREKVVDYLRKYNNNLAVFFGKRFAPGKSRLHIHVYEGKTHAYVIPHIDEFNWINSNIAGVRKSHVGYGAGGTITGNKYFLKSLMEYFSHKL